MSQPVEAVQQNNTAKPRTYKYQIGPWFETNITADLIYDVYALPAEFREDIRVLILQTLHGDASISKLTCNSNEECCCLSCFDKLLKDCLLLSSNQSIMIEGVQASKILPRFVWFRHELLRLYERPSVLDLNEEEEIDDEETSEDDMDEVPLVEQIEDSQENVLSDDEEVEKNQLDEEQNFNKISNEANPLQVTSKNNNIKILLFDENLDQNESQLISEMPNTGIVDPIGRFDIAVRDIQFRLAKHGILADPKSYRSTRGKEELYDLNDPFIDDTGDMADVISDYSAESNSEVEEDVNEEPWNSDMDEIYENNHHYFCFDNFSEEEEEDIIQRDENDKRIIKCYEWLKPTNLPLIYNPKLWYISSKRTQLPVFIHLFFKALEYALSLKKTQILQKSVFDRFEWVIVDEEAQSLKLNEEAVQCITKLISNIVHCTFESFLVSFWFQYVPDSNVTIPYFVKYIKYNDIQDPFVHGFCPSDPYNFEIIYSILSNVVTPYAPEKSLCRKWYWIAIFEHTLRCFKTLEEHLLAYCKKDPNLVYSRIKSNSQSNKDGSSTAEQTSASVSEKGLFVSGLLPEIASDEHLANAFIFAYKQKSRIAKAMLNDDMIVPAILLMIQKPAPDKLLPTYTKEEAEKIVNSNIGEYAQALFCDYPEIASLIYKLAQNVNNTVDQENSSNLQEINLEVLTYKKTPEERSWDVGSSSIARYKKQRGRNLIVELVNNLNSKLINSIMACPFQFPVKFFVSTLYKGENTLVFLTLHDFKNLFEVSIRFDSTYPKVQDACLDKELEFTDINRILDYIADKGFQIEGRSRSMTYVGFDNKIKSYCLLLLPNDLQHLSTNAKIENYSELLKQTQGSLKTRLNLLDVILFLSYLHADNSGNFDIRYLFSWDVVKENRNFQIYLEKNIHHAVVYSRNEPEDLWLRLLDRFFTTQLTLAKVIHKHWHTMTVNATHK